MKRTPGTDADSPRAAIESLLRENPRRIGVAYSGGMDSTVLLHVLASSLPRLQGAFQIFALYIDHGIRDSDERRVEKMLVFKTCAALNVPLIAHSVTPGELAARKEKLGASLEQLAREQRYAAFADMAERHGLDCIVTAHHGDDDQESLLMKFLQGRSLSEGIPSRRGLFRRPFLALPRDALRDYAMAQSLLWHEDSSNSDIQYLRNRVRRLLVPMLRNNFPGFARGLERLHHDSEALDDYLAQRTAEIPWKELPGTEAGIEIPFDLFKRQHPLIRKALLREGARKMVERGSLESVPESEFWAELVNADPGRFRGKSGQGIRIYLIDNSMRMGPDVVGSIKKGYLIYLSSAGECRVPGFGLLSVTTEGNSGDSVELPLEIASLERVGDQDKGISDLLAKSGLEPGIRRLIPVVEWGGQIRILLTQPWIGRNLRIGAEENPLAREQYRLVLKELEFRS